MTAILGPITPAAWGASPEFSSDTDRALLVELYVSEATKGSPGAEKWLDRLAGPAADDSGPALWKDFIPVVFPVDYGDKPGRWKDKFAKKEFTARLLAYAAKWGVSRPYVPTVMLNGTEWSGWAREEGFPSRGTEAAGVLRAQARIDNEVSVFFEPADTTYLNWTAHAAVLAFALVSHVEAGDNVGRTLKHNFVAVHTASAELEKGREDFRGVVKIPTRIAGGHHGVALVVWITRGDGVIPVQSVGGFIIRPINQKS